MNFPVGSTVPAGQPHVFLVVVGTIHDRPRCRLPVNGKLVLHGSKEAFCCRSAGVVVDGCGIDVGDFLVELALREADFPDFLQLSLEEVIGQNAAASFWSRSESIVQPWMV